ncbi:ferric reductase like transmembrane component [Xylariales sp. PMI_506]|nr:ferric reductase like transmembrane component [Xylariales sp. PMI_506]
MGWWYQFIDLDDTQKHDRRLALDRYGAYAQLSALLPLTFLLAIRFGSYVLKWIRTRNVSYDAVPNSPIAKHRRQSTSGTWATTGRRTAWWLGDDVVFAGQSWGRRDQLLFGTAWTLWSLFLCFNATGHDYMHLTKRFGAVAAAQFPVQYILALRKINPIAYALGSSHEELNRWHRTLGRTIYFLLCLHGIFYINYWIQMNNLASNLVRPIVVIGVGSLTAMTLLYTTALSFVRQYSYRVFFITHLLVAMALPPAIFFHVHHARVYMTEALVIFLIDIGARRWTMIKADAKLDLIPGTNLIKVAGGVPANVADRFRDHPGAHVFVSLPPESRPSSNPLSPSHSLYEFVYNPFTVGMVTDQSEVVLVARHLKGPLTGTLAKYASASPPRKVTLHFEGPYGVATRLPKLVGSGIDRVLLVAGGVGSTFILPIYQYIINENPAAKVDMVWAVRDAAEATWPASGIEKSVLDDDKIRLFLTGDILASASSSASASNGGDVELDQMHKDPKRNKYAVDRNRKRPDLKKIVDDVFREGHEDRVAVLVCGPERMARELRGYVGEWVKRGREVWWHNESFSW